MSFEQLITENQRLSILRALSEDCDYEHNESVLQSILAEFGLTCGRDKVRGLISWLKEQELVTVRDVSGIMVARVTQRGADVANGASIVPGVKRPGPGLS